VQRNSLDVRLWHIADSLSRLTSRPLSGEKQTSAATVQPREVEDVR
jgi:hypothetical protein